MENRVESVCKHRGYVEKDTMSHRDIDDWTRKLDDIAAEMAEHIDDSGVKRDLMFMCQQYQHAINMCTHQLERIYEMYKSYANKPPKDL